MNNLLIDVQFLTFFLDLQKSFFLNLKIIQYTVYTPDKSIKTSPTKPEKKDNDMSSSWDVKSWI